MLVGDEPAHVTVTGKPVLDESQWAKDL